MNIFDGLLGYERLMLICGFVLFVFALAAITVMIVQRRDFKAAMMLIVIAIVLMGFPGIQAVKFSQGMVELDRIRAQPKAPADPKQQAQDREVLAQLQQRADNNPLLQAKVSDGYRAIGDVDTAYDLAKSVLKTKPSAEVEKTLVPVLTAKLNQVQAATPSAAPAPAPREPETLSAPAATTPAATSEARKLEVLKQREIAGIAKQLQNTNAPLPAESHLALARAYVALDQPQQARTNVEAALQADPQLKVNPALLRAIRTDSATSTEH
jgi:tetratricopeptide (TPR) repeat protein